MTRSSLAAVLITLAVTALTPATASTAVERQVLAPPMPHTQLAPGGARVKVHYTRVHNNPANNKSAKQMAAVIKQQIDLCVGLRRQAGAPANPPKVLPDFTLGFHRDTYVARNRQITYKRQHAFKVNEDCSMSESEHFDAVLSSSKGTCQVNITEKTAKGNCDSTGHANAVANPPMPKLTTAETKAMMDRALRDPKTAQYMRQVQGLMGKGAGPTDQKKAILGIECDVVRLAGVLESQQCIARPAASTAAGDGGASGLLLELKSTDKGDVDAVEAKLDADVGSAVFTPYLGFKILAE